MAPCTLSTKLAPPPRVLTPRPRRGTADPLRRPSGDWSPAASGSVDDFSETVEQNPEEVLPWCCSQGHKSKSGVKQECTSRHKETNATKPPKKPRAYATCLCTVTDNPQSGRRRLAERAPVRSYFVNTPFPVYHSVVCSWARMCST